MPAVVTSGSGESGDITLSKNERGRAVSSFNTSSETSAMAGREQPVPADWIPLPKSGANRAVLYVHGGSFIVGPSPRITALVARLAEEVGAELYTPRPRLAPEHACPAAVDDIVAAYRWYRARWPKREMFAIAETSGAAILLAAMQGVRDAGERLPAGIILLSPWVDLSLQSWSVVHASLTRTDAYSMEHVALMAHLYLQGRSPTDAIASPLFGDFSGFPPLLIHAHKSDIVYDDAIRLAARVNARPGCAPAQLLADDTPLWEQMGSAKQRRRAMAPVVDFINACSSAATNAWRTTR
jgi:acetyl esterase/lipase